MNIAYDYIKSLSEKEPAALHAADVKALHKHAMEYFDQATMDEFNGEKEKALVKYRIALSFEKKAAIGARHLDIGEPTISVLFRSAASMAKRGNLPTVAFKLAEQGLSVKTPVEIATELESIKQSVRTSFKPYRQHPADVKYVQTDEVDAHTSRAGFIFIGNEKSLDYFMSVFGEGFAVDYPQKAINIIGNILQGKQSGSVPRVIILGNGIDNAQLRQLKGYLEMDLRLETIPIFVDASLISDQEFLFFRTSMLIDDIVFFSKLNKSLIISRIVSFRQMKFYTQKRSRTKYDLDIDESSELLKKYSGGVLKRLFDITIASLILFVLSPLFLLIAIAIRIESKGPIFYISKRAGKGYQIFDCYGFRTMVVDADKKLSMLAHLNRYNSLSGEGPVFFKISKDPRVTKVGSFLRYTSLNELPKFINVLLGDMSLVGNLPLPLYEAQTLTTDNWAERFMAPAGIIGLWQIKRKLQSGMSVEERIGLDIAYANHNNFMYDLWIMANTPNAILMKNAD